MTAEEAELSIKELAQRVKKITRHEDDDAEEIDRVIDSRSEEPRRKSATPVTIDDFFCDTMPRRKYRRKIKLD